MSMPPEKEFLKFRLTSLLSSVFCAMLLFLTINSWAQSAFPSKTIRIIVPNAPGGAADISARAVAQKLSERVGQAVVIDNKPSAGGIVAAELVAHAEPDGYTLLLISSGTAVSAALFKSLPFDTVKDFQPMSKMATFDLVIASAPNGRFKNYSDLLTYAKANPGALNIGTPQIGTTQNLAAEYFMASTGIKAQIVPFNGTPPVINALRGGEIDIMIDILGPLMTQITSKSIKALAVLSEKRSPLMPEIAACNEAEGLSGFQVSSWNGLAAPAKTPKDVIIRLNRELQAILSSSEIKKKLEDISMIAQSSSPEQAAELLSSDIRKWGDIIAKAKIEKQ
jgi:tripartite-type tricarboxylate transporter receptor subunit TctC